MPEAGRDLLEPNVDPCLRQVATCSNRRRSVPEAGRDLLEPTSIHAWATSSDPAPKENRKSKGILGAKS
jgi:hypothetical protein